MIFSILHSSARPDVCREICKTWMASAKHPENVDYVLCVDTRWGFPENGEYYDDLPANVTVALNTGRRCYVDGVNIAARASRGDVLIVIADDQYPCEGWDEKLLYAISTRFPGQSSGEDEDFVIEVSTGTPNEHERGIMVMPILSEDRYMRLGHVFYPEYESMYADNDFCEHARRDGVVIDARYLMFPHKHWMNGRRAQDEVDAAQCRRDAFQSGQAIFERRKVHGFTDSKVRTIALCLTGERYEGPWVDAALALQGHLLTQRGMNVMRARPDSKTNVYIARDEIRKQILACEDRPEFCLWIDDDNLLSPSQLDALLEVLDENPEVGLVAGWCWIHDSKKMCFRPSVGDWSPDRLHWIPFGSGFWKETEPRPFETGGFPCVLMRTSVFDLVGDQCFMPIVDSRLEHGMTGEDLSFYSAAEKAGIKMLVHPQVRLPHLKWVTVEPEFPEQGKDPVKVACMMRVKNEGRWIRRCIESVKAIAGSDIYVMEDGSSDNTVEEILAAGAVLLPSPFVGMGLDERRDKNWLLAEVKKRCNPDWIFMPDGDEELEPDGCRKMQTVLDSNPPVDVFALKFLFLWNELDTVRLDGVYGSQMRESLFRANSNLEFRSYYEHKGGENHVGLHTSNAPGKGDQKRVAPINVFLLHYGYLLKEDRIRKHEWILKLDPNNVHEDFYRHQIQGDVPEIPADMKLKHAGPRLLQKLPARLVPRFEMPGPFQETPVAVAAD